MSRTFNKKRRREYRETRSDFFFCFLMTLPLGYGAWSLYPQTRPSQYPLRPLSGTLEEIFDGWGVGGKRRTILGFKVREYSTKFSIYSLDSHPEILESARKEVQPGTPVIFHLLEEDIPSVTEGKYN